MTRTLAHRIKRLETRSRPKTISMPHVLTKRRGETWADARARFAERWGPIPRGHHFLTVPEQPCSPDEEAAARAFTEANQARLIEDGRQSNLGLA